MCDKWVFTFEYYELRVKLVCELKLFLHLTFKMLINCWTYGLHSATKLRMQQNENVNWLHWYTRIIEMDIMFYYILKCKLLNSLLTFQIVALHNKTIFSNCFSSYKTCCIAEIKHIKLSYGKLSMKWQLTWCE